MRNRGPGIIRKAHMEVLWLAMCFAVAQCLFHRGERLIPVGSRT